MNTSIKHVVIEDDCDCLDGNDPTPPCPERMIYIGELAQKSGFSAYKIRKWTEEGLIPVCDKPGEHPMYPEHQALAAIKGIRAANSGSLKLRRRGTPPPVAPPPDTQPPWTNTDGSQAA